LVEWEDSILCQAIYRGACADGNDFIITIPEVAELLSSHPDIKQNLPEDVFCIVRIISPFSDYGADYRSVIANGGGFVQILPCKLIKKEANFRALDPLTYPKEITWPPTKTTITEDLESFVCLDPFAFLVKADLIKNKRKGILEKLRDHVWSQGGSDYFICYLSNVYRSEGTWRPMYSVGFGNLGNNHHDYKGPELELIQEWEAYFDKKIPLTVLLQGRPGSGKTTLVKTAISHFHKKLKKRTLTMHSTSFTDLTTHEFHNLIDAYAPDILWIEDIDRIPQADLELCLSKIDRQEYEVPLTIFTSNNYKKLPQALYRPDRIDYIYKIDVVEGKISDEVLESALKRVNLTLKDLTEDHLDALRSRCRGCTPAEVLKYVRRGYVLGFDNLTSSYDLDVHMKDELEEK
jgi:tRNA A37 threonylcarbamoyladenosine biosynthesis protein TsaE